MSELLKVIVGVALVFWLVADGADDSISSEVARTCLVHNAKENNLGPSINAYCTCSGEMTANKADLLLKFVHQMGGFTVVSPYNISKEMGEDTHTACNAINGVLSLEDK